MLRWRLPFGHARTHHHLLTSSAVRQCLSAESCASSLSRGHIDQAKKIVTEIGRALGRTRYAGRSACRKEVLSEAGRAREWAAMWTKKGEEGEGCWGMS